MEERRHKLLLAALTLALVLLPVLRGWALTALAALGIGGILNRPVSALERRGIRRSWGAAALVLLSLAVLLALLLWAAAKGCAGLASALACCDPFSALEEGISPLLAVLPAALRPSAAGALQSLTQEGTLLREHVTCWAADWAGNCLSCLPDWLLSAAIILLGGCYAAADWPRVRRELLSLLPASWRVPAEEGLRRLKRGALGWLSVQGRLLLLQFVLLTLGLWLLGISGFLIPAALIALLDALPLVGSGAILLLWAGLLLLEGKSGTAGGMLLLALVLWLSRSIAEPRLMGKRAGVSPLWTLLAVWLGAKTLGVVGLIAAPILLSAVLELRRQ